MQSDLAFEVQSASMYMCCGISDTNGGGSTVEIRDVTGTEANVQGLTPGALYTFSVTAENAVSSQDSDITGRSTNATATTEEGGEGIVRRLW